jgi:hypothetical protein
MAKLMKLVAPTLKYKVFDKSVHTFKNRRNSVISDPIELKLIPVNFTGHFASNSNCTFTSPFYCVATGLRTIQFLFSATYTGSQTAKLVCRIFLPFSFLFCDRRSRDKSVLFLFVSREDVFSVFSSVR